MPFKKTQPAQPKQSMKFKHVMLLAGYEFKNKTVD